MKPLAPTPQRESVTPKRKKIKKDPNQPKRPLTPFFFFCAENRNAIKEKDPSRSVGDIAKILGAQWSQLTMDDKQIFEIRASADKERYEKEMAEYTAGLNSGSVDSADSPNRISYAANSSPKVVVQMPQTMNSHVHQLQQRQQQQQQQHQLSPALQPQNSSSP